jgi:hypothetical protein
MCLVGGGGGRVVVKRELLFISFDLFSFSQMFPLFFYCNSAIRSLASFVSLSKESASQREICMFNLGRDH